MWVLVLVWLLSLMKTRIYQVILYMANCIIAESLTGWLLLRSKLFTQVLLGKVAGSLTNFKILFLV